MITFLKSLFGIQQKPKSKYDDFSVEYYPETFIRAEDLGDGIICTEKGVYYAKYKSGYLKQHWSTGIIEVINWHGIAYGQRFNTEEDAWQLIDLFIEQRFKENVKIIKR